MCKRRSRHPAWRAKRIASLNHGYRHGVLFKIDEERLLKQVEADYRATAERIQVFLARVDVTARYVVYLALMAAYRFVELLYADEDRWEEFKRDPFWNGHYRLDPNERLRYAMI